MRKPRLTPAQYGVLAMVRAALVNPANGMYTTYERGAMVDVTKQIKVLISKGYVQVRADERLVVEGDAEWIKSE